jgi:hypothetical protein
MLGGIIAVPMRKECVTRSEFDGPLSAGLGAHEGLLKYTVEGETYKHNYCRAGTGDDQEACELA